VLQAVDVGRSQAEFAGARVQFDVQGADGGDELFGDFLGAVGGAVVDDYYFPVEVSRDFDLVGALGVGEGCCWLVVRTYCCLKVCSRSQTMMGRLRRSL
jgi:hypothetical protein